jgi:hypothetical protein
VPIFASQGARRALRRAIYAYATLLSLIVFSGLYDTVREIFGGTEAQLFVMSDAPLLALRASYAGQALAPRPGWGTGPVHLTHAAFAPVRTRQADPVLEISWQTQDGAWRTLHRVLPRSDTPGCLYVLRLDGHAQPMAMDPARPASPIWEGCALGY